MLRLVPGPGDVADRRAGEALHDLLVPMFEGLTGKRLRRHRAFEADLRACIEATGAQHLDADERALLEFERSDDPSDAVARTAPAAVLLLVLPTFLEEPRWEGDDDVDRKLRIDLSLSLARWILLLPELADVDADDEMEDVLDAWRTAHRRLRTDQRRRSWWSMNPRFKETMESMLEVMGEPSPAVEFGPPPPGYVDDADARRRRARGR